MADKWESDVHVVVKRAGDLPVYTVKPEGRDGPLRTLHRDLLLPCGFLPVAESLQSPKQTSRPRTRSQSRMAVTAKYGEAEDNSESEDNDYHYSLPGEMLHTDFIETRLLTWPETVPFKGKLVRETKRPTMSLVGARPVTVDLDKKAETGCTPVEILPSQSEKPPACGHETSCQPSSGGLDCSGWEGNFAVIDREDEVFLDHRGSNFPNVRRVLFEHSQNSPSDIARQDCETLPVQLRKSECPSTPEIVQSFTDEDKNEGCFGNEPSEDVSLDRTNEKLAHEASERRATSPVIVGESDAIPRRSQRHRNQPERLQYGQLGNPLLPIVQSLFQGLNLALADALQGPRYATIPHSL